MSAPRTRTISTTFDFNTAVRSRPHFWYPAYTNRRALHTTEQRVGNSLAGVAAPLPPVAPHSVWHLSACTSLLHSSDNEIGQQGLAM